MYVVTVIFVVKNEYTTLFRNAMLKQAHNSLSLEPDCHRFDVCFDIEDDTRVFLYEIYSNEKAFQQHLKSDHFYRFNAEVSDWLDSKSVRTWVRHENGYE